MYFANQKIEIDVEHKAKDDDTFFPDHAIRSMRSMTNPHQTNTLL